MGSGYNGLSRWQTAGLTTLSAGFCRLWIFYCYRYRAGQSVCWGRGNRRRFKERELDASLAAAIIALVRVNPAPASVLFSGLVITRGGDSAIAGILSGKSVQQCSPMAYSHVHQAQILAVWGRYLADLGLDVSDLPVTSQHASKAVGSRLYLQHEHFKPILAHYQQFLSEQVSAARRGQVPLVQFHNLLVRHCLLILNLSTAAQPVTEMYGRSQDHCLDLRFIRLTDKEARSVSSARMVPLTDLAIRQLRIWEKHLHFLSRLREAGFNVLAQAARDALDNQGALLFWVEEGDERGTIEVRSLTPTNMDVHFDSLFPLPSNWHRHAVRSHLLEQQVPHDLVDAMLGHEAMGFSICIPVVVHR